MFKLDQIQAGVEHVIGSLLYRAQQINRKYSEPGSSKYIIDRIFSNDISYGEQHDYYEKDRPQYNLSEIHANLRKQALGDVFVSDEASGYERVRVDWTNLLDTSDENIQHIGRFISSFVCSGGKILDELELSSEDARNLAVIFKALAEEEPAGFKIRTLITLINPQGKPMGAGIVEEDNVKIFNNISRALIKHAEKLEAEATSVRIPVIGIPDSPGKPNIIIGNDPAV